MKKNQLFLGLATIAAAVFSFSSCSQDELSTAKAETPDLGQEIRLTTDVSTTRSVSQTIQNNAIANGTKVGVFVTTTGSTTSFIDKGQNNSLTSDGSGNLAAASGQEIYFPTTGNVDIYGYAPHNSEWTAIGSQTFTVQTDQSSEANYLASDLLYATPLTNKAKNETEADAYKLQFKHKLSKINVNIYNERNGLSLVGAKVYIRNTKPTTTIDLTNGNIGTESGNKTVILAATLASGDINTTDNTKPTATASAIVVPQTVPAGNFIKIVTDAANNGGQSTTLYAYLSSAQALASGDLYKIDVTIAPVAVQLTLTTELDGWNDGSMTAGNGTNWEVGDYILKDGSLLKANATNFADKKGDIIAVIFSTTPSSIDETAGYDGYAMSVVQLTGRTWLENTTIEDAPTSLSAALGTLDGRTKTKTLQDKAEWASTVTNYNNSIVNFSVLDTSLPIDANAIYGSTADGGNKNLSGWFTPAFGQMIQILNGLGSAELTETTISSATGYSWSAGSGNFYTGTTNTAISAINTKVTNTGKDAVFTAGGVYSSVTENANNFFSINPTNDLYVGLCKNAGKTSQTSRRVIPCIAFMVP